jgi:tRNA(Arg) A34 adenosine deaminase TadA
MYMRRCLELAEIAALAGDTAVGAVIVCGDKVVAEGVQRTEAKRQRSPVDSSNKMRSGWWRSK